MALAIHAGFYFSSRERKVDVLGTEGEAVEVELVAGVEDPAPEGAEAETPAEPEVAPEVPTEPLVEPTPVEPTPEEIPQPEPIPEPVPAPEPVPEPEQIQEPAPEPKPRPKPQPKPVAKPVAKPAKPMTPAAVAGALGSTGTGRQSGPLGTPGGTAKAGGAGSGKPAVISKGGSLPYPPESKAAGERGSPVVSFTVDTSGRATGVRVSRSSGFSRLDAAAIEWIRRWRFKPAMRDGVPFAAPVVQKVTFQLN